MFRINRAGMAMSKQERPAGQEGRNCVLQTPRSSLLSEKHFGQTSTKVRRIIKETNRHFGKNQGDTHIGTTNRFDRFILLVNVEKGNH